jgi:hypothetical protein
VQDRLWAIVQVHLNTAAFNYGAKTTGIEIPHQALGSLVCARSAIELLSYLTPVLHGWKPQEDLVGNGNQLVVSTDPAQSSSFALAHPKTFG